MESVKEEKINKNHKFRKEINDLRKGFKYSFITLVLLTSFAFLCLMNLAFLLLILLGLPLFLLLFTWGYSLIKRSGGWRSLGRERISDAIIFGGIVIFCLFFSAIFAWSSPQRLMRYYYYINLIPPVAWGIYTFLETQGFKWLKMNRNIDLTFSRICSLIGILVYTLAFLVLCFPELPFPKFTGNFLSTFCIRFEPFLYSSPFLIASCVFAIRKLQHATIIV